MLFLFHRKGSTELVAYTRSSLRLCWKISTLTLRTATLQVVFSAQILCMLALRYLCLARKKESAYSDLWTHKKNVTMDKQKVNTTSSTDRKGYSSSSHYRISSGLEECVHEVATKFVQWEVQPLENLSTSKPYLLRVKLNQGENLSREEKDWLCEAVNSNTYFRTAVPVMGYRFDFLDVLKKFLVNQYGHWAEYYAPDRTSIRKYLGGHITQIVEAPKY